MNGLNRKAFLFLILAQVCHSVEEYETRLYDVLPPARFLSDLLSLDRRVGFAIFNTALVAFGLWCFFGPVRRNRPPARALAWFWVALELFNGTAHIAWALSAAGYRPGLATAPVLVVASLVLAWSLRRGAEPAAPSG